MLSLGGNAKEKPLKITQGRRRKGEPLPETPEGQLKALSLMQKAGYVPRLLRCAHCKWSLGKAFVYNDKHVYQRCINEDCRRRTNILGASKWMQNVCDRQSLSPMQMHSLLLAYTSTHLGSSSSPYVVARSIGSTYKPVTAVLTALPQVESDAGKKANDRCRMPGALELDATSLRKVRIGSKTQKYSALVEQWRKRHRGKSLPKHFLLYLRVFGCCKRGSTKMVLRPCEHRLVPAGGKPPVESTQACMQHGSMCN